MMFAEGSPISGLDVFSPPCPFTAEPRAASDWRYWSKPETWPDGIVPGVGSAVGINVTIPCGVAVLLDMPVITVSLLSIQGLLRFLDSTSVGTISLNADFIIVEGQLFIGSALASFSQTATITLTPNLEGNRRDFLYMSNSPASASDPRNLGHKAFVVIGGQVKLFGMPGGSATPTWTKLRMTADAGQNFVDVSGDVSSWPNGAMIAISSTDYLPEQAESFTIVSKAIGPKGTRINLDRALKWTHFGDPQGIPDGFGGFVDECAEVALLSRNIVVQSAAESEPYELDGGHFMVYFTKIQQIVEGVEFVHMGQQGVRERYPINFMMHGSQFNKMDPSVIRKNSIHDSYQRCVVLQGVWGLLVEQNVAYHTQGHCYVLQDGSEIGNTFSKNVGILTQRVARLMPNGNYTLPPAEPREYLEVDPRRETDDSPATFLITNPNNSYIGNVAGGSEDTGFWIFLQFTARGYSQDDPNLAFLSPFYSQYAAFEGNVMHSNLFMGIRTIPNGGQPRQNAFLNVTKIWKDIQFNPPARALWKGLNIYKQQGTGVIVDTGDSWTFDSCTFADNDWGLYLGQAIDVVAVNSRFIGLSENYGSPFACTSSTANNCAPVDPTICSLPLAPNVKGRSTGYRPWPFPQFGIVIDQGNHTETGRGPELVINCTFANFDSTCRPAAGIAVGLTPAASDYLNAAHSISGARFSSANEVYIPGPTFPFTDGAWHPTGEFWSSMALRDESGSVVGGRGGYALANSPFLLPPGRRNCVKKANWNGFACYGVCYRTVFVQFYEDGFSPLGNVPTERKRGEASFITLTRQSDGQKLTLDGNLNTRWLEAYAIPTVRFFFVNLLAGEIYDLKITPPARNPTWAPLNLTIGFKDGGGCLGSTTVRFQPSPSGNLFQPKESNAVAPKMCGGTKVTSAPNVTFAVVCSGLNTATEVKLGGNLARPVFLLASQPAPPCSSLTSFMKRCAMLPGGSFWRYDASGRDLHALYLNQGGDGFQNPLFSDPSIPVWPGGKGPFGFFSSWVTPYIVTVMPSLNPNLTSGLTYYFRTSFTVANSACYKGLFLDLILDDGAAVFLNGREILRSGLPSGYLAASTKALQDLKGFRDAAPDDDEPPEAVFTSFYIPLNSSAPFALVEGLNFISVEVHTFASWAWQMTFDLRISGDKSRDVCKGALLRVEVCDGVDNNADGRADAVLRARRTLPLTAACVTKCGRGTAVCMRGIYRNCTAPPSLPEICNGKDDDCDGMVDNGVGQLDCGKGSVCFKGRCLPIATLSSAKTVWPRGAPNWLYYDMGGNYPGNFPKWASGEVQWSDWKRGTAPLGYNQYDSSEAFGSSLKPLSGKFITHYFLKAFVLTADEVAETNRMYFNIRRDDGAVVYINGHEIFRSNMPGGQVTFQTLSSGVTQATKDPNANNKYSYYPCTSCLSSTSGSLLKAGQNFVAVELHQSYLWSGDAVMDMDLYRNVTLPCPASSSPSSSASPSPICARPLPPVILIPKAKLTWRFLDGSMPIPPASWMVPGFVDTTWKKGIGMFGTNAGDPTILNEGPGNSRITFYFRAAIRVPDAPCFFGLTVSLLANDAGIVYINGKEVVRHQLPAGPITALTRGAQWGNWIYNDFALSGGWLKAGLNVIAVELHKGAASSNFRFDLSLSAIRDGVCTFPA